jgi:hypothetical protein
MFDEWGLYLVHHKRWTDKNNLQVWIDDPKKGPGGYLLEEMYNIVSAYAPNTLKNQISGFFNTR